MTKIILPKCPYCKKTYEDKNGLHQSYDLLDLAKQGWKKEAVVKCSCGKEFRVTCNIVYYASRINKE